MGEQALTARAGLGRASAWLLAALVAAIAFPGAASADLAFCPPGAGPSQCSGQSGVATDFESGRLYVADTANNRIEAFDSEGNFLFAFGEGLLKAPTAIAVDNDPASPSHHDIYVYDSGNFRVVKFDPAGTLLGQVGSKGTGPGQFAKAEDQIAIGPGGALYVGDTPKPEEPRIEEFEPSLALLKECELPHKDLLSHGLAVDSSGDIYAIFNRTEEGVFEFKPNCEGLGSPHPLDGREATALAIDGEGHLFVAEDAARAGKAGSFRVITELEPGGAYLKRFGYGIGYAGLIGIKAIAALHSTDGDVFASLTAGPERLAYLALPPPGPVIAPLGLEATPGSTKAALAGELNPEGTKPTKYRFKYVDAHSFETEGGFASPKTKETPEEEVAIKPSEEEEELFRLHAAEAPQIGCANPLVEFSEGKCLSPETKYRYELVASNAKGKAELEGEFETKPSLEIEETWASEAGTGGARLNAKVNPLGVPATGYFEYVDEESFEASGFKEATQIPDVAHGAGPLDFGSGEASVRSALLEGLVPGRSYRYRLVATDPLLEGGVVDGPIRTLRPFQRPSQPPCPNDELRSGAGALLPDCRAYELVSPLDKNNGDIVPLGEFTTGVPAALNESAVSGQRVSFTSYRAFGDTASAPFSAEYLAERGPGGWQSHSIDPPRGKPDVAPPPQVNTEFKLFSPDLCDVWQRTVAEPEPPLSPQAVAAYPNVYRRTDQSCGGAPGYEAITTVKPPHVAAEQYYPLELQGTSANGDVAIYAAPDNLAPGAPEEPASCTAKGEGCQMRLYEKRPGQEPRFVCIGPKGEAIAPCGPAAGVVQDGKDLEGALHNAISADGERIYWSGGGKLYLRVGGTETLAVSEAGEALSGTKASRFLGASADGSRAVYLSGEDLYEFDAESKATRLDRPQSAGDGGDERGRLADLLRLDRSAKRRTQQRRPKSPGGRTEPLPGRRRGEPAVHRHAGGG